MLFLFVTKLLVRVGYNEGKRTSQVNSAGFEVDDLTGYTKSVRCTAIVVILTGIADEGLLK